MKSYEVWVRGQVPSEVIVVVEAESEEEAAEAAYDEAIDSTDWAPTGDFPDVDDVVNVEEIEDDDV